MTIQRILPNGKSEQEHWNDNRANHGHSPTAQQITKIRPDLMTKCGCKIDQVYYGEFFTIEHNKRCWMSNAPRMEAVRCSPQGQAVASLADGFIGVMELNGRWPHEEQD